VEEPVSHAADAGRIWFVVDDQFSIAVFVFQTSLETVRSGMANFEQSDCFRN
jgi:hypothetical protein